MANLMPPGWAQRNPAAVDPRGYQAELARRTQEEELRRQGYGTGVYDRHGIYDPLTAGRNNQANVVTMPTSVNRSAPQSFLSSSERQGSSGGAMATGAPAGGGGGGGGYNFTPPQLQPMQFTPTAYNFTAPQLAYPDMPTGPRTPQGLNLNVPDQQQAYAQSQPQQYNFEIDTGIGNSQLMNEAQLASQLDAIRRQSQAPAQNNPAVGAQQQATINQMLAHAGLANGAERATEFQRQAAASQAQLQNANNAAQTNVGNTLQQMLARAIGQQQQDDLTRQQRQYTTLAQLLGSFA